MPNLVVDDDFHRWLRRRRLVSESTITSYEYDLRRLERHSGIHRDLLTLTHVEDFLQNGYSPATKQRAFIAFRLRHRWGALAGMWELDEEIDHIRLRRRRHRVRPALTTAQAQLALSLARTPVEVRTFYLGLYSGVRLASMVAIDETLWCDGIITVPPIKGSWEALELPVHPALEARRDEILSESPGRRKIQRTCVKFRSALGVPVSAQWLRRTYSQRLRVLRVEGSVRTALMGHAPATVGDEFYAPPTWEEMVQAQRQLNY